jgi:hypothetical protein
LTLLFETRFVQTIYSDVPAGQEYTDALGTYRREQREFAQKVAKEAKISIEHGTGQNFAEVLRLAAVGAVRLKMARIRAGSVHLFF